MVYSDTLMKSYLGNPGFDVVSAAEATWGRSFEQRDFLIMMRQRTSSAILGMDPNCQKALGQRWNLYDGQNSFLAKVDRTTFLDGGQSYVAQITLSDFGIAGLPGISTVGQLFSSDLDLGAFVGNWRQRPDNNVFVRGGLLNWGPALVDTILIHEMLHVYTGLNDPGLANQLGLPAVLGRRDFDPTEIDAASEAISTYLNLKCPQGIQ
jgi:hypothetical protein